jgi:hypothetical protein
MRRNRTNKASDRNDSGANTNSCVVVWSLGATLRTKFRSTWLTTFLLIASGCHKEKPAQSVEPSDTKPFDVAEAMMMVYGNYDVKAQTSVASLPKEKSSFPAAGEEQMTIRMLFNTFQGDAGARRFLLATYAVPTSGLSFDCHACAPTIGMATFVEKRQRWTIDSLSRAITPSGEWGKPPTDIQLAQIGPSRQALQIIDVGKQNGETTRLLQLLIPWNGRFFMLREPSDSYLRPQR